MLGLAFWYLKQHEMLDALLIGEVPEDEDYDYDGNGDFNFQDVIEMTESEIKSILVDGYDEANDGATTNIKIKKNEKGTLLEEKELVDSGYDLEHHIFVFCDNIWDKYANPDLGPAGNKYYTEVGSSDNTWNKANITCGKVGQDLVNFGYGLYHYVQYLRESTEALIEWV